MIVRFAKEGDLEGIKKCANTASLGMIHLPKENDLLEKKISASIQSSSSTPTEPSIEEYLFVLENEEQGSIGGTSGITAKIGINFPYYVFQVEQLPPLPDGLLQPKERRTLQLKGYRNDPSELCALYLLPEYRHGGYGKLLSLSRLLFIASFPERFDEFLIANMRGFIENEFSPFWEGMGKHFLDISFKEVIEIRVKTETFIPLIFPQFPIPVSLLDQEAQNSIGKTHPNTKPAVSMLLEQGFRYADQIDPIDAGPILITNKDELHTLNTIQTVHVDKIVSHPLDNHQRNAIVSNGSMQFRSCYAFVNLTDHHVSLSRKVADALQIQEGDTIKVLPLKETNHGGV